ncbi:hypothetical protein AB5I39_05590 [Sphingomonas sp. MMS24-J45]|uniref:hypothetical protein n=1 Tax=Sphingomonas sp. MMS24-J45 TaxID=3238806 RepID=UPI00384F4287
MTDFSHTVAPSDGRQPELVKRRWTTPAVIEGHAEATEKTGFPSEASPSVGPS